MPFAALKGYSEALRRKEKITVPKPEFSEEYQEELDRKLRQMHKNDMVSVVYFSRGEFRKVTGMVARIDSTAKLLKVVDTKIPMGDIYEIEEQRHL
nr:YolD-like family protein [Mediterraneibacter glycyrrhizinilyticus]